MPYGLMLAPAPAEAEVGCREVRIEDLFQHGVSLKDWSRKCAVNLQVL